ncbi:MAG: DUF4270 domain-containing protein [Bacteroidales bacterium]|jgi:hypothetical protein|nr:DUF4270 domain-containing protein [Bacteroidales bacterium]
MTRFYHSPDPSRRPSSGFILNNIFAAFLAGIVLLAASCEEDPTQIGRNLLPSGDSVSIMSTDTFNIKAWTMYSNSLQSDNPSTSYLGQLYDPYFGTTSASFVTQIRMGSEWNNDSIVIDSIKLYLNLLTVSGAVDKPHYLKLSEIDEEIYTDSVYYSARPVPLTGFSVSNILLPELQEDTINRIELDIPVELGYKILDDTSMLFYNDNIPDFRSYFKGLLFELTTIDDPIMVSLSLSPPSGYGTSANYFEFFMHDESDVSTQFYFIIDAVNRNASYNRYIHDFNTAVPEKKIPHRNDTSFFDTLSYVQTMNGVYTRIWIPGLEAIKNNPAMKGIAVNKAKLIMPIFYDDDIYTPKTIPSQLYLRYVTRSGSKYIVPDYSISSSFFDGKPDTTNAVYNLNVAAFLQGYLEDKTGRLKPELELFMNPASSYNVILKANNSHTPVKFEFTYSRF